MIQYPKAPFTLPFHSGSLKPFFRLAICIKVTEVEQGGQFHCTSYLPLEVDAKATIEAT